MRKPTPTIRQVAKACNVSPMTVSHVLNGKLSEVGEETRERVLKAVREMGYRPSARVHSVQERAICTLGVVAGIPGDTLMFPGYYFEIMTSLLRATDRLGHNTTLFTSSLLHTDTPRSLRVYCDGRCDGLIVIAPNRESPLVQALQGRGFPFVLVGDTGDGEPICSVDVANVEEATRIVRYLAERGHRRIAFMGGPGFVRSAVQRQQGYQEALEALGLPINPAFHVHSVYHESRHYEITRALMQAPPAERPTAFFAWNDTAAGHVLRALQDLEVRVPEEASLIGFDDHPSMATLNPPVTTARQPYREIGERAVHLLLEQIHTGATLTRQEYLPAALIERASVAPPPECR